MTRCYCGEAARWWKATANPMHAATYCDHMGRVAPYRELTPDRPTLVYDDGIRYNVVATLDGTAYFGAHAATMD